LLAIFTALFQQASAEGPGCSHFTEKEHHVYLLLPKTTRKTIDYREIDGLPCTFEGKAVED